MGLVFASATVASMDAGVKPTWTYLRRVAEANTELMSITELISSNVPKVIALKHFAYVYLGQQWDPTHCCPT